jgi:hypothetical protein
MPSMRSGHAIGCCRAWGEVCDTPGMVQVISGWTGQPPDPRTLGGRGRSASPA